MDNTAFRSTCCCRAPISQGYFSARWIPWLGFYLPWHKYFKHNEGWWPRGENNYLGPKFLKLSWYRLLPKEFPVCALNHLVCAKRLSQSWCLLESLLHPHIFTCLAEYFPLHRIIIHVIGCLMFWYLQEALKGDLMMFPYAVSVYINAVQQSSPWLDGFSFMLHNCLLVDFLNFLFLKFPFFFFLAIGMGHSEKSVVCWIIDEPVILVVWNPLGVLLVCLAGTFVVKLVTRFGGIWCSSEWQKFLSHLKSIGVLTDKSIAIAGGLVMPLWFSSWGTCGLLLQV